MPGRQRFQIEIVADPQRGAAAEAVVRAALGGLSVHAEDRPVSRRIGTEEDGPRAGKSIVDADVRLSRSQPDAKGVFRALASAGESVTIKEHECFHGLEGEEDAKSCLQTLSVTRFVNGEQRERANG